MKKAIIPIIILFCLITTVSAYQWGNTSNLKMDMDFGNGGVQENQDDYNTSSIIGSTSLSPFNETGITYNIHQGMLYIIWSNVIISDFISIAIGVNCTIINQEIEWGEINCTSNENVNWSFSIKDRLTNETYHIFDKRTGGKKKFVGLEAGRPYEITINATDVSNNLNTTIKEFRTKTGKENMEIAMVIGMGMLVVLFLVFTITSIKNRPFLANFFFLITFIFTTIATSMIHKITVVNDSQYEPIAFISYRIMLIITMLMIFIVLILLTGDVIRIRKIKGNPVDHYRDNLGKNE